MKFLRRIDARLTRAGMAITHVVGTMWCAIAFAALALVSLPAALKSGDVVILVSWVAQTFLQLVLLSIILVGQAAESARTEARDQETHDAVMAEHAETRALLVEMHALLTAQHIPEPSVEAS